MIQNKDRLTITLSPQIKAALIEMCEVQGLSASALITTFVVREIKENSLIRMTYLAEEEKKKK